MDSVSLPILPTGTTSLAMKTTWPSTDVSYQVTLLQYVKYINDNVYGQGKTSSTSRFNIPGKIGWITMEVPGTLTLLYCMHTVSAGGIGSLPLENKVMGALFVCSVKSL